MNTVAGLEEKISKISVNDDGSITAGIILKEGDKFLSTTSNNELYTNEENLSDYVEGKFNGYDETFIELLSKINTLKSKITA